MTLKTVSSVIDDLNEWENPRGGSVYYVTAICTDEDVLSVGRKDYDAALEVQGLLREAIGVEQDFTLEPAKPTKTGRTKWKVLGFGTPGGAATYTAPGAGTVSSVSQSPSGQASHLGSTPSRSTDVDASIRAAVALKAAASFLSMTAVSTEKVLEVAEFFEDWLQRKASEPALSAYPSSGTVPVVEPQAGAGSETTSPASSDSSKGRADANAGDDRGEGVGEATVAQALGEGTPATSPHYPDDNPIANDRNVEHEHDWQPHPQLRGKLKCECGAMRNKVA